MTLREHLGDKRTTTEAYALWDERHKADQCIWCGAPATCVIPLFLAEIFCSQEHGGLFIEWYSEVEGK